MKILVYGAGVIGSIYAAKFHESGCNVTLLARDKHYDGLLMLSLMFKKIADAKIQQTIS